MSPQTSYPEVFLSLTVQHCVEKDMKAQERTLAQDHSSAVAITSEVNIFWCTKNVKQATLYLIKDLNKYKLSLWKHAVCLTSGADSPYHIVLNTPLPVSQIKRQPEKELRIQKAFYSD